MSHSVGVSAEFAGFPQRILDAEKAIRKLNPLLRQIADYAMDPPQSILDQLSDLASSWFNTKSKYTELLSDSRQIVAAAARHCNDLTGSLVLFLQCEDTTTETKSAKLDLFLGNIEHDEAITTVWSREFDIVLQDYQFSQKLWNSIIITGGLDQTHFMRTLVAEVVPCLEDVKTKLLALTNGFHALVHFYTGIRADLNSVQKQLSEVDVPGRPSWTVSADYTF
ncbi:hypothetical protein K474DRAFT_119238 [Panus rudis PR-1116 ss-1]|nr:hypothetical protein K474DRAFT_119238 [Panus rudis PR-1116 ss-1]